MQTWLHEGISMLQKNFENAARLGNSATSLLRNQNKQSRTTFIARTNNQELTIHLLAVASAHIVRVD